MSFATSKCRTTRRSSGISSDPSFPTIKRTGNGSGKTALRWTCDRLLSRPGLLSARFSQYGDSTGELARQSTQVVGQADLWVLQLTLGQLGLALKLFVYLVYHAQPAGADGMPKTL